MFVLFFKETIYHNTKNMNTSDLKNHGMFFTKHV